ncbi:hypothetical protein [Neorhizobium galegae]|uniref:hypothetical protein n=1 Tax=Neorhizobium galegae TaxID=399 RepID=UPI001FD896BC|nr:hypothetical protein [Neorhizobium galegae]
MSERLHGSLRRIRLEPRLLPDPFRAFSGDGTLRQLVPELDLELGTVKAAFPTGFGNEELASLLTEPVSGFSRHKGRGSEYELQAIDLGQLGFQGFEGVDRKARSCNFYP